jgi:preprotein translocase subunit SecD
MAPRDDEGGLFSRINLGLDLRGGIHLVLQVVTDDALSQELALDAERMAQGLQEQNIQYASAQKGTGNFIEIKGIDSAQDEDARGFLNPGYDRKYNIRSTVREGKSDYTFTLRPPELRRLKESTVVQALETVRRRVDALGVAEPTLQIYGGSGQEVDDQIIVELPGIDDPERVKGLLQQTSQLELRLVKDENGGPFTTIESAVQANGGRIPDGWEILPYRDERETQAQVQYMVVRTTPAITGSHLKDARRTTDGTGAPAVGFFLNSEGAEIFSRVTEQHIGDNLAIILDGLISSAPTIEDRIGAEGIIRGQYTVQQAEDQSLLLRSGALPADLRIIEERTVGASLGNDSIRAGVQASLIGFGLVVMGMLIYYKRSGANAVICLVGNLIILMGFLGAVGATLTLPGIAGVILTIGMAVDSNILIFERIREELRAGKTIRAAVDAGFGKVFWTIFDTHTTTLIAAAFLFQFGTGPIRGFAITLFVGLIANMFTAVYVSHRLFELMLGQRKLERLSI